MSLNSLTFLLFFVFVSIVFYIIPKTNRCAWLLICSYIFYASYEIKYVLLLATITFVSFLFAIHIEKKHSKLLLTMCLICCFGILISYKYINVVSLALDKFRGIFIDNNNGYELTDIIIPAGMSYYIFEATSYVIDVYRGKTAAHKNILKYALFISYFPKLISGPIEKENEFISKIDNLQGFNINDLEEGALLVVWGKFLKCVIADRISIFVNFVYADINEYTGYFLIVAVLAYAFQIYCDFYGYSTMALGFSKMLGIDLSDNFNAPYLASSTIDFWKRWHISLTNWLREYIYITFGGNRFGRIRQYISIMIVFLVSGMWHGSDTSFIVWGMINGLYQIIGNILKPIKKKIFVRTKIKKENFLVRLLSTITTFLLIDFSWIFFRSSTTTEAITIINSIIHANNINILFDRSIFTCGLDRGDALILLISLMVLLYSEVQKIKGINLRKKIVNFPIFIKSIVIVASICFILIFGKWGPSFDASSFIYANF